MGSSPFTVGFAFCFIAVMIAASAISGSGPVVGVVLFVAAFIYAARNARPSKRPGE